MKEGDPAQRHSSSMLVLRLSSAEDAATHARRIAACTRKQLDNIHECNRASAQLVVVAARNKENAYVDAVLAKLYAMRLDSLDELLVWTRETEWPEMYDGHEGYPHSHVGYLYRKAVEPIYALLDDKYRVREWTEEVDGVVTFENRLREYIDKVHDDLKLSIKTSMTETSEGARSFKIQHGIALNVSKVTSSRYMVMDLVDRDRQQFVKSFKDRITTADDVTLEMDLDRRVVLREVEDLSARASSLVFELKVLCVIGDAKIEHFETIKKFIAECNIAKFAPGTGAHAAAFMQKQFTKSMELMDADIDDALKMAKWVFVIMKLATVEVVAGEDAVDPLAWLSPSFVAKNIHTFHDTMRKSKELGGALFVREFKLALEDFGMPDADFAKKYMGVAAAATMDLDES